MSPLSPDRPDQGTTYDYRRAMRDMLGRALEPASATTVHLATEPPSHGLAALSRVDELLARANTTSPPGALELRPLATVKALPEWFSTSLRTDVEEWLWTIAELVETRQVETSPAARQSVALLVASILDHQRRDTDLFHLNRAEIVAKELPGNPTPLRREQIPPQMWDEDGQEYVLRLSPLHWVPDTPAAAITRVSRLSRQYLPDEYWLAEYAPRVVVPLPVDPLIFARYGDWFVEVARWPESVPPPSPSSRF